MEYCLIKSYLRTIKLVMYSRLHLCLPGLLSLPQINTLRPRQNGRHEAGDIFKCIFLNENVSIAIKISLNIVPKGPINNIPALVQIMAWRRPGDKPLSEPMMISLPTHICVTRPQWIKWNMDEYFLPWFHGKSNHSSLSYLQRRFSKSAAEVRKYTR